LYERRKSSSFGEVIVVVVVTVVGNTHALCYMSVVSDKKSFVIKRRQRWWLRIRPRLHRSTRRIKPITSFLQNGCGGCFAIIIYYDGSWRCFIHSSRTALDRVLWWFPYKSHTHTHTHIYIRTHFLSAFPVRTPTSALVFDSSHTTLFDVHNVIHYIMVIITTRETFRRVIYTMCTGIKSVFFITGRPSRTIHSIVVCYFFLILKSTLLSNIFKHNCMDPTHANLWEIKIIGINQWWYLSSKIH